VLNTSRRLQNFVKKLSISGFLLAAAASVILAPAQPVLGQELAVRPQKPLQHEVTVALKLVQVYVTDKKGKPVTDLQKGDFTLTDNGDPVTITEFERHVLAPATAAAVRAAAPTAAAAPAADKPDLGRKFFLFIDFAFNTPRGALKAKEAALSFLDKQSAEGDEVGLISYSTVNGLKIHEFLTTDRAKVRQALLDLNVKAGAGRADDVEQEYWRLSTQLSTPGDLSQDVMVRRQDARSQARAFILKLNALAKAFRYIPGHKNLLLFSTGIASSLIYGKTEGTPQGDSGRADRSKFEAPARVLVEDYEELFRELRASNITIYSFDTRETAKPATLFDYDDQTFGSKGTRDIFTAGGLAQNPSTVYKGEDVTGLYALSKLSKSTGGRYFGNINEYAGNMSDLQAMTGSYYVLGYSIGQSWDGAFHEIKVGTSRKGVDVRTQLGYYAPKPFTEYTTVEKTLHLLDLALSEAPVYQTPLYGTLQALAGPGDPGAGKDRVVLLTRLPANTADRLTGAKAEIVTFVFDAQDRLADMRRAEESLAGFGDKPVFFASSVALAPGEYSCRVVVRDLDTGAAAIASCKASVPTTPAGGLRFHTPLLLGPAVESVYREGRLAAAGRAGAAPAESWTTLYPFDPAQNAPLPGALSNAVPALRVVLPMTNLGQARDRVGFRAALLSIETAERFGLTITPVASAAVGATVIQTFDIATAGLTPGRYTLYFYAEDKSAGSLAHVSAPLVIR